MITLTKQDFREVLKIPGWNLSIDEGLHITLREEPFCFVLDVPASGTSLPALVRALSLLGAEEEGLFGGAFLWYGQWGIGSPQLEKVGWGVVERMRLGYGEVRPVEVAPVHRFREDELLGFEGFLLQPFIFQWDANVVLSTGDCFTHISHDGYVIVASNSKEETDKHKRFLAKWSPRDASNNVCARFSRRA